MKREQITVAQPPLRIMQLTSGDLWAGAEVQFFTLCRALLARDDVVLHVVVLNEGELSARLREIGAEPVVLDENRLSSLQIFRELLRLLRQWRPQVLHSHRFKENVIGGLAAALARVPSLRTMHGAQEVATARLDFRRQLIHWLDVGIGRFVQKRVVAVTEDLRAKLLADYPPAHVVTVPNGIAFEALDAAQAVDSGGGRAIGIVGRLTEVKRIDLFLQMAQLLLRDAGNAGLRFLVIGGGPLQSALEQQAQQLGIADRVRFTGHVSPSAGWIRSLDVLVMCSDHEGMPMTLLEAMRLRTPIVAHRVGGLVELLAPQGDGGPQFGELVADHSVAGYADAVQRLLAAPQTAMQRADDAWRYVTESFSAQTNAARFVALYGEVVGRR